MRPDLGGVGGEVEVSILGPLKVWGDEGAIDIGGPLRRVLLTRLVVAGGRIVPAERLVEDVWGDGPPVSASTLQSHISHLRRALGADRLGSESGGYCVFLAGDEVDATVFEEEVREARRLLDIHDAASAAAALGTALARWRGPALADAGGAAWAEAESARLEELRLVATESFLDARLALGHHRDVVAEAEAAVAEHPLRERLWAQLVLALYRCGRQAEALRAYQRLRATLGEELGIEPSPELRDLERLVLDQDAALDLDVVASAHAGRTLPTGVVTFLLTDVVGSTRLWETAAAVMGPALARHDEIVRDAVDAHGGVLLKARGEGDSTFSVFGRATDAVAAARAVARSLAAEPWPPEAEISVRMAAHTGEAEERDGDYYGRAVNRVARVRAIAGSGEILLTRATADLVVDHLPADVHLVERGAQDLRDIDRAEVLYELVSDLGDVAHGTRLLSQALATAQATGRAGGESESAAVLASTAAEHDPPPLPAALATETPFPFVGRSDELAALADAWKDARAGRRRVVLVAGELGLGKTRLAAEVATAARQDGGLVLFGRCDEDVALPYQPFVEALRPYVADAPRGLLDAHVAEHGGTLARLIPEFARRVPDAPPPASSTDPETERYQLFEAVAGLLALAGRHTPILLVLDDLHWASRPTALLLRHLVRAATAMPLLVVGTYRHTDLGDGHPLTDVLADLRREPAVQRVELGGLSDVDAVAFAEAAAGHHLDDASVALAYAVHRDTDGNPFFMGELYFHVAESGVVRAIDGRWVVADDLDHVNLPESVREVVGGRVRRLGESARAMLGVAAVIGAAVDVSVLAEAMRKAPEDLLDAVEEAMTAAMLIEVAEAPGRYRFAHGVLRSTIYDELSAARRLHLHARVAAALETVRGPDAATADLAHHWYRATPAGGGRSATAAKAAEALTRAGRRAMASAAFEEAVGHHQRALEVLDSGLVSPDDLRRVDALVELGIAQFAAGDLEYRETLFAAARLARDADDTDRLAQCALALSPGSWSSAPAGEVDAELVELLEAAIDGVGTDGPERPRLLAALAMEINYAGDLARQRALLNEALATARRHGDASTLVFVLARRLSTAPADVKERLAESAELLGLTAELGDPVLAYVAAYARMNATWAIGDVTETDRLLAECVHLAEQSGRPFLRWSSLYAWTARLIATCRLDEAEVVSDEYMRIGTSIGSGATAWAAWSYHTFQIRLRQGQHMDEVVDRQLQGAATGPPILGWRTQVPLALCEVGRDDEARAHLEADAATGFAYMDDNPLAQHLLPGLASACVHLGATEVAPLLYERLLPYAGELGSAMGTPNPEAPMDHHLGALAALMGRHEEADERFTLALELEVRTGDRYWEAQTRLAWSRSLLARGDVDKARALTDEVARASAEHGFITLAGRASEVRTQLDRWPHGDTGAAPDLRPVDTS